MYNRKSIVVEALNSVVSQAELPGRLIIVDDGSTDGSAAVVDKWISQCKANLSMELLCLSHQGAPAARNRGLNSAKNYPWVAFLDSDDLWPNDFLMRCCRTIYMNPDVIAVTSDRKFILTLTGEVILKKSHEIEKDPTRWLFCGEAGIGSASLFRRDKVEALGGFDENIPTAHDAALFLPLSLHGPWRYVSGKPVIYRHDIGQKRGEQTHIYQTFDDYHRRVSHVLENFLIEANFVSRSSFRKTVMTRWRWAGWELFWQKRVEEAQACFLQSIRWRFFNRAWYYLIICKLVVYTKLKKRK